MVNIRHLPRRTKVSKLLRDVPPIHDHALPDYPGWDTLPLNQKLPILDVPLQNLELTRDLVGNKLWKKFEEFVDFDPKVFNFTYESLHDKLLKHFFEIPIYKRQLRYHGQLSEDAVLCSVKQMNDFRSYLARLILLRVKKIISEQDKYEKDKRFLTIIDKKINYENGRVRREPTRDDILRELSETRALRMKEIKENYRNSIRNHKIRMKIMQMERDFKRQMRNSFEEERMRCLRERRRRDWIDLVLQLRDKDNRFRYRRQQSFDEKKQKTIMKAVVAWEVRIAAREKHKQQVEELFKKDAEMKKENIEKRRIRNEKNLERTMQKHMSYCAGGIRRRYEHSKLENVKEALKKGVKKLIKTKQRQRRRAKLERKRQRDPQPSESQESFYSITKKRDLEYINEILEGTDPVEKALQEVSTATVSSAIGCAFSSYEYLKSIPNSLGILELACEIIRSVVDTPDPILPSDNDVLKYAEGRVRISIEAVKEDVLVNLHRLIEAATDKDKETPSKAVSLRTVRFGEINTVEVPIEEDAFLHPISDRSPTPVTSLQTLADITMAEPRDSLIELPAESEDIQIIHMTKTQKILIERNCELFRRILGQTLEAKCREAIDFKRKLVKQKVNADLFGVRRDYLVEVMAHSILKLPTDDLNFGSNLKLAASVIIAEILEEIRDVFKSE